MRRRLRQHPQHHPAGSESDGPTARRLPFGLIWLVLTVLVLVLVIVYDRRSINQAKDHVVTGRELESKGLYVEALDEYEQAFENKRLGRNAKGGVALSMADIYFKHLEDYPTADRYYTQARQNSPKALEPAAVQERVKLAAARSLGSGIFRQKSAGADSNSTRTVIQRVELLQMPQTDRNGPVVASYNGGEIRAGQVLRALEKRPEFLRPDFREDPKRLEDFLNGIIRETLAYEASVSTGVHKDPDVSSRLYDYQKSLVTQRYLVDRREQALVVDNVAVESYYQANVNEFVKPGQITVSLIKTDSETTAGEILQMLRDGKRFEDLSTSYSIDKASAAKGGNIGIVTEKDTTISGVGEAPQIVEALFKLPVYSVSEVTPNAGAFYIFRISGVVPAVSTTLDEARGKIENILRGRSVDQARSGLDEELNKAFDPKVNDDGLKRFWDFARQTTNLPDSGSTATQGTTTSGTRAEQTSPTALLTSATAEAR